MLRPMYEQVLKEAMDDPLNASDLDSVNGLQGCFVNAFYLLRRLRLFQAKHAMLGVVQSELDQLQDAVRKLRELSGEQ